MGNFIDLKEDQTTELSRITKKGTQNFANGYRYLYSILPNAGPSGDPVRDQQLEDLKYWLRNAPDVNENNPYSAANQYIRGVTGAGLRWDGKNDLADPTEVQATSNEIGKSVIGDVLYAHGIPPSSYLRSKNPAASRHVRAAIYESLPTLILFPRIGRPQKVKGVRKLVTRKYAYLIYYTVDDEAGEIVIQNIKHPAQKREHSDS